MGLTHSGVASHVQGSSVRTGAGARRDTGGLAHADTSRVIRSVKTAGRATRAGRSASFAAQPVDQRLPVTGTVISREQREHGRRAVNSVNMHDVPAVTVAGMTAATRICPLANTKETPRFITERDRIRWS